MAQLKIYTFPDLVLSQKALPIGRVEARHRKLAEDMLETMYFAPGVGLAANQVGVLERIIVVDTDYEYHPLHELDDDSNSSFHHAAQEGQAAPEGEVIGDGIVSGKNPRVLINPEIIRREGKVMSKEGCLSVPEFTAEVERAKVITVQFCDFDGLSQKMDAEGLLSMCIQHELDHLEGRLFIDRLSPAKKELAKKRLLAEREARELEGDASPGSDFYDMAAPKLRK